MDQAIDFTNEYAAEHLQIMTRAPFITLNRIKHAGSIFMGPYAPVPVGDYASGTNHVLPTGQCARMFSGLSVDDFIKKPTFQSEPGRLGRSKRHGHYPGRSRRTSPSRQGRSGEV